MGGSNHESATRYPEKWRAVPDIRQSAARRFRTGEDERRRNQRQGNEGNPQAVKQAIERNREAFEKGAQVPGGAYDVDPAYAAAAAEGADDSFGGDLDEQSKSP